jgi:glyoxylase-like metal-dependent hydrolase (beta-lactamase superfamily II)
MADAMFREIKFAGENTMKIVCHENGPFMVNTYLVYDEGSMRGFILDPGSDVDGLAQYCETGKIQIEAVVATHAHIDHVAGVSFFQQRYGVPFYCSSLEKEFLGTLPIQARMFGVDDPGVPVIDRELAQSGVLELSNIGITLLHTPGHSPGSVSLYIPEAGVVFCGDALFNMSIGRTDLPGGSYEDLITSIREKLLCLPGDTTACSGHGPATTIAAEKAMNPFLV